jgi:acyl CoA:acetate/3-ketoacid CoA transferase beta subunit
MGAHPGGLFTRDTPAAPYGEDLEFWSDVQRISRTDEFDAWIDRWVLGPADQEEYLAQLGDDRIRVLADRADPESWRADQAAHPPDLSTPTGAWELAAVFGARYLADRIVARGADAVLAGAGVANLASWLGVQLARDRGAEVALTAELGLWGYEPTPADPFVFNHRSFPTATMLSDSEQILGLMAGSPGTTLLACLGAAQIDRFGNINSTVIPGRAFLVGSGGGNDVASRADEVVVMATLTGRRTVDRVPYITSPGQRVRAFVSDLGIFEKGDDDTFVLTAVAPGPGTAEERVGTIGSLCGWELSVARDLTELAPAEETHVHALRRWDPRGHFLRPDA